MHFTHILAACVVFFYGLILIVGGIFGYSKAGSLPSLFTGILSGSFLLFSAISLLKGHFMPFYLGMVLTFLLTSFFLYRWVISSQLFPGGIMAILSFIILILSVFLMHKHIFHS